MSIFKVAKWTLWILGVGSLLLATDRVNEPFDTNGALVGQIPMPPGVAWAAFANTGVLPVQVSAMQMVLNYDTVDNGEDVVIVYTPALPALESIYVGFDLIVPTGTIDPSVSTLVVSLAQISQSAQTARIFLLAPSGAGDFRLGLATRGSSPNQNSTDLAFDTTYRVVLRYTNADAVTADSSQLDIYTDRALPPDQTLNDAGLTLTFPPATDRVLFFQSTVPNQAFTVRFDNLLVTDTPMDAVPVTLQNFMIE